MAEECKRNLVGKFIRTRPQIEKIRSKFAEKVPLKGNVKIGVYDFRTVFLDFTDEEDFNSVWFKRSIEIEGQVMWLEKWTPDFKPEEDSPIVPVWVLLPDLPFHCHTWHYVKQILAPIGTPLSMDLATDHKTRPSMAKVRVEIDLTKSKLNSIWVGTEDVSFPLKGYNQKLEYESVPKFCRHCKILGHSLPQCRRIEKKNMEEDKIDATKITADNIFEGKIKQHDQGDTTEGQSECNKQVENSDDLNNDKQEYDQGRKKNKYEHGNEKSTLKERLDKIKRKKKKNKVPKKRKTIQVKTGKNKNSDDNVKNDKINVEASISYKENLELPGKYQADSNPIVDQSENDNINNRIQQEEREYQSQSEEENTDNKKTKIMRGIKQKVQVIICR
ncbi:hypothetical protein P3L10_016211 [Capsicum annuum]